MKTKTNTKQLKATITALHYGTLHQAVTSAQEMEVPFLPSAFTLLKVPIQGLFLGHKIATRMFLFTISSEVLMGK